MIIKIINKLILVGYKASRLFARFYRIFLKCLRRVDLALGKFSPLSSLIDILPLPRGMGFFLSEKITYKQLFEIFETRGIRYVVLRWFDGLPNDEQIGDVDLLIHHDDINLLRGLFTARLTGKSFDIYTVSARYGFTYKNLPYYPPHLGNKILSSRVKNENGIYTPTPEHYFYSLAYHALYHKGDLALVEGIRDNSQNHSKYTAELAELSEAVNFNQDFNFCSLHTYLSEKGWGPSFDTFRKLASTTPALKKYLPELSDSPVPDIMVFVLREAARDRNLIGDITEQIKNESLSIFYEGEIDIERSTQTIEKIRGGEWGKEDFPYSYMGGLPCYICIVIDNNPEPVCKSAHHRYPSVKNGHTLLKHQIRHTLNADRLCGSWANLLHCSDDVLEALDYIDIACPQIMGPLLEKYPHFSPFLRAVKNLEKGLDFTEYEKSAGVA